MQAGDMTFVIAVIFGRHVLVQAETVIALCDSISEFSQVPIFRSKPVATILAGTKMTTSGSRKPVILLAVV